MSRWSKARMPWRQRLRKVIFEAETPLGKAFDVFLLWSIVLSVLAVVLESIPAIRARYGEYLLKVEWGFTILFTIEYFLRMLSVRSPKKYVFSFLGLVDLLSIIPTYLSMFFVGAQSLLIIRVIRLLRVFRVFKLKRYLKQADVLTMALRASRIKITVFLGGVFVVLLVVGTLMYMVEGEQQGFTSIPQSIYWAVVTMTTVGYGDVVPTTIAGKIMASAIMIVGYGILAVPTGIVSVELAQASRKKVETQVCPGCSKESHDIDAVYCKYCGEEL